MRFTSLIVELVRAKPRMIFWTAILLQAGLWLILPLLLYTSPPSQLTSVLAFGHEYQIGTQLGPPLAFWLADIAFRLAGGHMIGVYLLAQICFVVMMWAVFTLARNIVGAQQAILAALLTATITAYSYPGLDFGPLVLARPLWALILLHAWRVFGQGKRSAWFVLSIEIGLLFLTTQAAALLVAFLLVFALATAQGRRTLQSLDPLFAALVVAAFVVPYLVWLAHASAGLPRPSLAQPVAKLREGADLLLSTVGTLLAIALLAAINARWFKRKQDDAPVIYRPAVTPFARKFVFAFACVPPIVLTLVAPWFGIHHVLGGEGVAVVLVGLAVIVAAGDLIPLRHQQTLRTIWLLAILAPALVVTTTVLLHPWTGAAEVETSLPARDMGRFFAENYRLRVNRPLPAVAGDPQLAALISAHAPSRPHVFFDADPATTPWLSADQFSAGGGVVVWRAADTIGAPPDDIAKRFPGLVAEVPRTFDRLINGRQDALRVGWGVVRPGAGQ